jgi:glycosyltransferase involved in cell wall biosynthesis
MYLSVIIPVFNEQDSIKKVIKEWMFELNKYDLNYKFIIINDGSIDNTQRILNQIISKKIKVFQKKRQGHGKSCLFGYLYSIKNKFTHILQIDGDGQCNPKYFRYFFENYKKKLAIYGYRYKRDDGLQRKIFSRLMEIIIFLVSYKFLKDPNTPYRLINTVLLKKLVYKIPKNISLVNVYLTYLLNKHVNILYIPIRFHKRYDGTSKHNLKNMFKALFNLLINLKKN